MTNRDIYDTSLALLAEQQDELSADYEERAPHILAAFFCECREVLGYRGTAEGQDMACTMPDLDDEFPLPERFFSAGAHYLAATLVETENEELCDRLFARYASAMSSMAQGAGEISIVRDVYGFSRCE